MVVRKKAQGIREFVNLIQPISSGSNVKWIRAKCTTRPSRYGCGLGGLDIRSRARASEFRPKSNRHDTPPTFLSICGRRFYASSTLRKLDDPLFPPSLSSFPSFSLALPLALSRITLFCPLSVSFSRCPSPSEKERRTCLLRPSP